MKFNMFKPIQCGEEKGRSRPCRIREACTFVDNATGFRVLGYALAFRGSGRVTATNINERLSVPAPISYLGQRVIPVPSQRELLCNAILSMGGNMNDRIKNSYVGIRGGWSMLSQTSHLNGLMPAGGNVAFLDGQVDWRRWGLETIVRTDGTDPSFWW